MAKCMYHGDHEPRPDRKGPQSAWMNRRKAAFNAFEITFEDACPRAESRH